MDYLGDVSGEELQELITTEDKFHEGLALLLRTANANGVDIRGAWPIDGDEGEDSWDLEITKISRRTVTTVDNSEFPASAIVGEVAAREDVDPNELPPLYDSISPEILKMLDESENPDQQVTFAYCGYDITVTADGSVTIDG